VNILQALASPHLFGNLEPFRDLTTWRAWIVFLKAVYGLPMTATELEIFRERTGRTRPLPNGYSEAVAIVGRQSGKSQIAAMIAVYEATRVAGRGTYAVLVCQDERAALRTLFRYATEPFEASRTLHAAVVSRTANTIELETGVSIAAYPCRPAAIRGLRSRAAICDELAFFRSSEGYATDIEMLRALRPTLATTGGKLIVLSSPYGSTGALWDLHRRHFSKDSATLVWTASAPEMNPSLPADYLARMAEDDPEAYRSEVLGEFRAGVTALIDAEALAACVVSDRRELLRREGVRYLAHVDPSGGGKDAFALAIGHRDHARVIVDVVRAWHSKNPEGMVAEAADLLRRYGVSSVRGDRYSAEWSREAFRKHGIAYQWSELDKSALFLELLPIINSGAIELLDDDQLLRELRGLERRRGSSGRDRVDHRPGEHDDRANVVAGVAHAVGVQRRPRAGFGWITTDEREGRV
jgi:hypothetical protein